jgi:hypothetical protein
VLRVHANDACFVQLLGCDDDGALRLHDLPQIISGHDSDRRCRAGCSETTLRARSRFRTIERREHGRAGRLRQRFEVLVARDLAVGRLSDDRLRYSPPIGSTPRSQKYSAGSPGFDKSLVFARIRVCSCAASSRVMTKDFSSAGRSSGVMFRCDHTPCKSTWPSARRGGRYSPACAAAAAANNPHTYI